MSPLIPLVTASDVSFWITAPLVVLCALAFLMSRKPVHSAIAMAGVMIGLAVLYATLEAPFLFVAQIIVYTGAILMLFLFVVMLVGIDTRDSFVEVVKGHRIASILVAAGLGILLILAVAQIGVLGDPVGLDAANAEGNVEGLAKLVFEDYFVLFLTTAALLIIAPMAALILTHPEDLTKKANQWDSAQDRMRAYALEGRHPGARPNSGVYARHNSIAVPALLPDGSVSAESVSEALLERGVAVDIEALRSHSPEIQQDLTTRHQELEGKDA